ncbi:acyltransferase family protein [Rhodovulum visakhapatnamense]|uniref:Peptidoglycan/LPS O-acetylase OafA/YrhL n=1 Tax=Rhodovulum visakhapatnamense TaxID=364297 RepID=A0A4R8F313_9RHOB|nr:acyltransferase family protein [Rhodovulum visakhapatnamense]TDX19442.1 peptidoglycan/LPS O-acetylase OafA/YrhL [Rhodovulum visakhapatnamense]
MRYRPDIDGLRALAVLPVILYHADIPLFGGGFVGVDVFFVVSGFLITGILISELDEGRFSILRFYERRSRRILPALFAMMIVSLPFALALMLPSQLKLFGQSFFAIVVFASNILFWKKVDYFAAPAEESPLLHTWSLAVEEQFYVIFPILLWLLWKLGRRYLIGLIIVLSIISLGLAEWASSRFPGPNFYLLPTRAWELGVGAMAAFWIRRPSHLARPGLSLFGVAMILAAIFLYSDETPFPSFYTLLPVLGAALVVLYGANSVENPPTKGETRHDNLAAHILCNQPMVFVGLISYSAYLWHQPIFAFARLSRLTPPPMGMMAGLALLSLLIAWLSWRFVEQPFRRPERRWLSGRQSIFAGSAIGMAAFAAIGYVFVSFNGFEARWRANHQDQPALLAGLDYHNSRNMYDQFVSGGCFFSGGSASVPKSFEHCFNLDPERINYVLIGDSFAAQYAKALEEHYSSAHLVQLTISGCRPIWNGQGLGMCTDLYKTRIKRFIEDNAEQLGGIIIAAHWRSIELHDLEHTINWLHGLGLKTAIVGPGPDYGSALPEILIKASDHESLSSTNRFSAPERWRVQEEYRGMAERTGARFLPIMDYLCTPDGACQNFTSDGDLIIFDYGHLTLSGTRDLIKAHFPATLVDMFSSASR